MTRTIDQRQIQRDLRVLYRKLGSRTYGTHALRRTFGRMLYDRGVDLLQIRTLMGHQTVEMTAHYIGVRTEEKRDAISRLPHLVAGQGKQHASGKSSSEVPHQ